LITVNGNQSLEEVTAELKKAIASWINKQKKGLGIGDWGVSV
jgi:hypothetical protein